MDSVPYGTDILQFKVLPVDLHSIRLWCESKECFYVKNGHHFGTIYSCMLSCVRNAITFALLFPQTLVVKLGSCPYDFMHMPGEVDIEGNKTYFLRHAIFTSFVSTSTFCLRSILLPCSHVSFLTTVPQKCT